MTVCWKVWDNAASVDMKIGFDPVIADYEVGLDTMAECSFCHKNAIVTKVLKCVSPLHIRLCAPLCAILIAFACCQNMELEPRL